MRALVRQAGKAFSVARPGRPFLCNYLCISTPSLPIHGVEPSTKPLKSPGVPISPAQSASFKKSSSPFRSLTMATAAADAPDVYHMGLDTLRISRRSLHGKQRERLVASLRAALPVEEQGIVLLQGGGPDMKYTTDGERLFEQESYLHYLFGVVEEEWFGALDVRTGRSTLFMARLPDAYAVWMGRLKSPEEVKARYAVDEVKYTDEMVQVLQAAGAPCLHVLKGVNTDSGAAVKPPTFEGSEGFTFEDATLFDVLTEQRVFKTPEEVEIIRYANQVGARGHVAAMQACKPGMMEYQLESTFLHTCYSQGGCRTPLYTPIAASGPNGAILHYGHSAAPNDRQVQAGDMVLLDFGCEYYHYGSDITATWPAWGKFSPAQRVVYEGVLAAQEAVKAAMKPGVAWPDMHSLANRTLLEHLLAGGLLQGSVEDMMGADIGALFMPHGLGHFLGLDTHDVGGYLPGAPPRIMRPGYKSLRTARVLQPGMVITVEPGCYFNPVLLGPAYENPAQAKFLVKSKIQEYMDFGGVRIEDNVVITQDGAESLTHVPRSVADIERVMAGEPWPLAK